MASEDDHAGSSASKKAEQLHRQAELDRTHAAAIDRTLSELAYQTPATSPSSS